MPYTADLILCIYSLFNALRVVSYLPQIVQIARDQDGAKAISLTTWWLWVGANGTTVLYAWVNLGDLPLAALNGMNTLACLVVIALTISKRRQAHGPRSRRSASAGHFTTGLGACPPAPRA